MVTKRVRLPLLVEHRAGSTGVYERIEVDFEQVLRSGISMSDVGKLRIARGDQTVSATEAKAHYDVVNLWGAGNSSVNNFIGGDVPKEELGDALRRFACWADVFSDGNIRGVDWDSAMPASRWIEPDGVNCFEANKALFLRVRDGGSEKISEYRRQAKERNQKEIALMAIDVYAPVLSDALFRGGPAEMALWNCNPQTIDSLEVVEFKARCKRSEAGRFLKSVMTLVDRQFASEREAILKLTSEAAAKPSVANSTSLAVVPGPSLRTTKGVRVPPHARRVQKIERNS